MNTGLLLIADVGHGHMGWDDGWWIVMAVGMVLLWGLAILGVIWAVRELTRSRGDRGDEPKSDAVAILDRRLASGEISVEEYRERRAALDRGTVAPDV